MPDRIFWEYLEELPEQEAAFYESSTLSFCSDGIILTFSTRINMKIGERHAKLRSVRPRAITVVLAKL